MLDEPAKYGAVRAKLVRTNGQPSVLNRAFAGQLEAALPFS
jgi:hypothetical protein